MSVENFLSALQQHWRYLGGPSNLVLCVSKKNRGHTLHQSDYMSGKVKRVEILKNEAQSHVEYSDKTSCATFFQVALENFL